MRKSVSMVAVVVAKEWERPSPAHSTGRGRGRRDNGEGAARTEVQELNVRVLRVPNLVQLAPTTGAPRVHADDVTQVGVHRNLPLGGLGLGLQAVDVGRGWGHRPPAATLGLAGLRCCSSIDTIHTQHQRNNQAMK